MSAGVALGLLLAVGTAFASVAGFLYKFRGARAAPDVDMASPIASTIRLFANPIYSLGILLALGGWFLHVGALALAPISLVQATIAGGLVLLNVTAERLFGIQVSRRQWIGVGMTSVGLAALALTLGGAANAAHSRYGETALITFLIVCGAAAALLMVTARSGNLLAVSAGLYWATSDTSIKALSSHASHDGIGVLLTPLAVVILVASLVGLLVSAQSLQRGDAVPVIALTSAAANLTTIAAGPLVFGESLGHTRLALVVQLVAFALVVVASAVTPPPLTAETAQG